MIVGNNSLRISVAVATIFIGRISGQAINASSAPTTTTESTSTVTIVLPSGAPSTIQASILAAVRNELYIMLRVLLVTLTGMLVVCEQDPSQTVYVLGCNGASGTTTTTNSKCGFATPVTLTQGPSTLVFTATDPVEADFTKYVESSHANPENAANTGEVLSFQQMLRPR
jgi:hypothetical protein